MWRFFLGLSLGIYCGTYYDCKPVVNNITEYIKKNLPEKKD